MTCVFCRNTQPDISPVVVPSSFTCMSGMGTSAFVVYTNVTKWKHRWSLFIVWQASIQLRICYVAVSWTKIEGTEILSFILYGCISFSVPSTEHNFCAWREYLDIMESNKRLKQNWNCAQKLGVMTHKSWLLLFEQEQCGGQRCGAQEGMKDVYKFYLEKVKENYAFRGVSIILNCNIGKMSLVLLMLFIVGNSGVLLGVRYWNISFRYTWWIP